MLLAITVTIIVGASMFAFVSVNERRLRVLCMSYGLMPPPRCTVDLDQLG